MERRHNSPEFENDYCKFRPYDWIEIDSILRPILFKVVTKDLKSLGLRRNPNIMTFEIGDWTTLPNDQLLPGEKDWGGIWSALKLSDAKTLSKHMLNCHQTSTRIFAATIDNPLYANSYRVKAQSVMLLKEVEWIFASRVFAQKMSANCGFGFL